MINNFYTLCVHYAELLLTPKLWYE